MIKIQEINFPVDCVIVHNEFHDYDPLNSFKAEDSIKYLDEDLLQCTFPLDDIIVDLGWYGDCFLNKGEFKIQIIQNEMWDMPVNEVYSKSVEEVKILFTNILEHLTRSNMESES